MTAEGRKREEDKSVESAHSDSGCKDEESFHPVPEKSGPPEHQEEPRMCRPSRRTESHVQKRSVPQTESKNVFVDAESMKAKVRQNLAKPKYNVRDLYKTEGFPQAIARSPKFEALTLCVISINAFWISVDTDMNHAETLIDAHPVFQVAENMFCLFFTFELSVRFASFAKKASCLRDAWFVFDSVLVVTMVLETWVMTLIILLVMGGAGGDANAGVMRIARLLRLSRMARMARLLRAMPELMILLKGMMAATRSVIFTLILLGTFLYVFAIAFTQMAVDTPAVSKKYFNSVPESMYSLLIHGALMDSIGPVASDLGQESYLINCIFFLFVLLAALTVLNMLIGVLCEVVSAVAATEKEEMLVGYVNGKLREVVMMLDEDGTMSISKKEFMQILDNADAIRCLQDIGVDVVGLVDFADAIFETENIDEGAGEDKELSFADFMEVVLQLRGSNNATVKDIVDLRKFIRNSMISTSTKLESIREGLNKVLNVDSYGAGDEVFVNGGLSRASSGSLTKAEGQPPAWPSRMSTQTQPPPPPPQTAIIGGMKQQDHELTPFLSLAQQAATEGLARKPLHDPCTLGVYVVEDGGPPVEPPLQSSHPHLLSRVPAVDKCAEDLINEIEILFANVQESVRLHLSSLTAASLLGPQDQWHSFGITAALSGCGTSELRPTVSGEVQTNAKSNGCTSWDFHLRAKGAHPQDNTEYSNALCDVSVHGTAMSASSAFFRRNNDCGKAARCDDANDAAAGSVTVCVNGTARACSRSHGCGKAACRDDANDAAASSLTARQAAAPPASFAPT